MADRKQSANSTLVSWMWLGVSALLAGSLAAVLFYSVKAAPMPAENNLDMVRWIATSQNERSQRTAEILHVAYRALGLFALGGLLSILLIAGACGVKFVLRNRNETISAPVRYAVAVPFSIVILALYVLPFLPAGDIAKARAKRYDDYLAEQESIRLTQEQWRENQRLNEVRRRQNIQNNVLDKIKKLNALPLKMRIESLYIARQSAFNGKDDYLSDMPKQDRQFILQVLAQNEDDLMTSIDGYVGLRDFYQHMDNEKYQALTSKWGQCGENTLDLNSKYTAELVERCLREKDWGPIKVLIKRGYDIHKTKDAYGEGILEHALFARDKKMFTWLMEQGISIDAPGFGGTTLLVGLCASQNDRGEWIDYLLKHGADPNRRDANKRTCLQLLVQRDRYSAMKVLLNYPVDVNARDADGMTVMDYMSVYHGGYEKEIRKILKQYNALRSDELPKITAATQPS